MTVDELKIEAKKLGYNIVKIPERPEKLLPCICGSRHRSHWESRHDDGLWYKSLRCKCGRRADGLTKIEVNKNWNNMIRKERENNV